MGELSPNAFEVFSSAEVGHENHLTRALLVLLRLSPLTHQVWLRQIGLAEQGLTQLGEPAFAFQTGRVPNVEPGTEGVSGVSVFITRDEPYNRGPVHASDRAQIPDALITYPGRDAPVVVVVESKVHGGADETQAREINLGAIKPAWSPTEPVELGWADLIDELWELVNLELLSAAERRLLLDFFDYVDRHYRQVGPFSTLGRCAGVQERILRRCRTLIAEATGLEAQDPFRSNGPYVELDGPPAGLARRVYLDHIQDPNYLRLSFWPADTPNQARAVYGDPSVCQQLVALAAESEWHLAPNMHFGHFQQGLAWVGVPDDLDVKDYVTFWQSNADLIGVVHRPPTHLRDWDSLIDRLRGEGMIASREDFDHDFTNTNRTRADVRPGLQLCRQWPMSEAIRLDDGAKLLEEVRAAYNSGLQALS